MTFIDGYTPYAWPSSIIGYEQVFLAAISPKCWPIWMTFGMDLLLHRIHFGGSLGP